MKETVEGIILNETNYGETSKILNILTKEHGYISVIAKGSRTMKSKLRGVSMKFIYANFVITYKESGISNLISPEKADALTALAQAIVPSTAAVVTTLRIFFVILVSSNNI